MMKRLKTDAIPYLLEPVTLLTATNSAGPAIPATFSPIAKIEKYSAERSGGISVANKERLKA